MDRTVLDCSRDNAVRYLGIDVDDGIDRQNPVVDPVL